MPDYDQKIIFHQFQRKKSKQTHTVQGIIGSSVETAWDRSIYNSISNSDYIFCSFHFVYYTFQLEYSLSLSTVKSQSKC